MTGTLIHDRRVIPMAAALWMTERHFAAKRGIELPAWADLDHDDGQWPFVHQALQIIQRRDPEARLVMHV